jgi:RHS repeat-associated protein
LFLAVKAVGDFHFNRLHHSSEAGQAPSASYGYDDVHRKTSESVDYGSFSLGYAYDYYKNGSKKSFTGPDGVVYQYTYDDADQLASVAIPNQGSITFSSYLWNRPSTVILPGGSRREYSYDPLMRIQAITVKDPLQNAIMGYTYTYDKMDNIRGKATEHGPYAYDYDELYRLKTVDNPTIPDEAFTYDPVGNRLTSTATSGNWNYNANNELSDYNGVSFEYDANGNTTKKTVDGSVSTFIYDIDNRIVRVEDGSGTVIATYYYDPFGRRLWKEVGGVRTNFLYADEGLVGEYDAAGAEIKTYGYKPGSTWTTDPLFIKQAGQYFFYQNDHLGTPQKMTNVNGGVVWSAKYESFGKAQVEAGSSVENNLTFPGQYYDQETGLHYNYHRDYHPGIGRYVEPDPIGLDGGINLYTYVGSNPLRSTDPFGLGGPGGWAPGPIAPRPAFNPYNRAPGASNSGCRNEIAFYCDEWCCDWDQCWRQCRAKCPMYNSPDKKTVHCCLRDHSEEITICDGKITRYGHPGDTHPPIQIGLVQKRRHRLNSTPEDRFSRCL